MQAGQRFEDPSQIDFLGVWEDVRKAAYDPHSMITENEEDGVWGSCLQPSQGLFWYRVPDSELLTEVCRVYNDWITDFCKPYPERLKGIAMLNVDDVDEACQELERSKKLGLVGAFIPVAPLADKPYRHPIYERLWWTAQDLDIPLLLHIATPRHNVPGNEFTIKKEGWRFRKPTGPRRQPQRGDHDSRMILFGAQRNRRAALASVMVKSPPGATKTRC
jgi:hypothetical protein